MFTPRLGVRARILAVALVPSVVLLIIGVGGAGYAATQGRHARNWSEALAAATPPTRDLVTADQLERQYSIVWLIGGGGDPGPLLQARSRFDAASRILDSTSDSFARSGHAEVTGDIGGIQTAKARLVSVRAQVDAGTLPIADAYDYYSHFLDAISVGSEIVQADAPTPAVASAVSTALTIVSASEMLSRSAALGVVLANNGTLTPPLAIEYSRLVGGYRTGIESLAAQSAAVKAVTTSPAWLRLIMMENTLLARALDPLTAAPGKSGAEPAPMSFTPADWTNTTNQANNALLELWDGQMLHAHGMAAQAADRSARTALIVGSVLLVAAIVAFMVSLLLANRMIGRLKRLRDQTLALASDRLPQIMARLGAREDVDVAAESAPLAFGTDEIGQVADAFNHAQTAAVAAAVTEARTREGVRAVFLNIAHRSQVVVHRQLEILDEAESHQEDPALLDIFFRLDHLTTRERRNSENLVILAGGEPGRRWRNPVPLVQIIRSSVSEAVDFGRVRIMRTPEVMLTGSSVADLVHLLAELIDNAANFSPPQTQVEVRSGVVGKGVVVEIADQGMGMLEGEFARINDMLADPPDFGVGPLSEDSRLGIFVVAQLAYRNDVTVRLTESDYSGVRAIVLIPSKLLVAEPFTPTDGRRAEPESARMVTSDQPGYPRAVELPANAAPPPVPIRYRPRNAPPAPGFDTPTTRSEDLGYPGGTDDPGSFAGNPPAVTRRLHRASLAPEPAGGHQRDEPAPPWYAARQTRDPLSADEDGTGSGRTADPGGFGTSPF
ncbi:nitrate- and nitrite sensing domain-containing protein [Nocardia sp. BMG111209]|uniref:sensor histidine kinase n=1 Tax=Nocardia sp. BMG111209 TaxID=1160137 RepID=UPI00035CD403|nr:nitrate- and nitrite sensing domain-containing protein [Nocardia sp. BMG111209]